MHPTALSIPTSIFSFEECLRYLGRNPQESTHLVEDGKLYTLLYKAGKNWLLEISHTGTDLVVQTDQILDAEQQQLLHQYIQNWFDLDTDLNVFYTQVEDDAVLQALTKTFRGLRMVRMPNLFEALCWAVLGQQINLNFAYKLKRQFAAKYGAAVPIKQHTLYQFPSPETVAGLDVETLKQIQFSRQKANYIIGIAQAICDGTLEEQALRQLDFSSIHQQLVALKGVGNWTANYILMKVFGDTSAFPIEDVGLHNALKVQLGLNQKPSIPEIRELAKPWAGWEAYATFYLWHSLLEN